MNQDRGKSQEIPVVIPPPPPAGDVPVLQKLSSPPFPRSGFPFLGILASVYEHVTAVAGRSRPAGGSPSQELQSLQNSSKRA